MYPAKKYIEQDTTRIHQIIKLYPLASLIYSDAEGAISVCHIPLVLDQKRHFLLGHMVANNPLAKRLMKSDIKVTGIFNGPDTYISPNDATEIKLPTWHYSKVEVTGTAKAIFEKNEQRAVMDASIAHFEADLANQWQLSQADQVMVNQLFNYITVFRIEINSWMGSFKLSQDKSEQARTELKASLLQRGKPDSANAIGV